MVEVQPKRGQSAPEARGTLGLPQATALIVGSIIGVGIFNLPYSLAAYGPISLVAMALDDGRRAGPGAPVRRALASPARPTAGRTPTPAPPSATRSGFANAWSYWITAWAGNAAIAVGWVFYVEEFVNKGADQRLVDPHRAGRPVDPGGR